MRTLVQCIIVSWPNYLLGLYNCSAEHKCYFTYTFHLHYLAWSLHGIMVPVRTPVLKASEYAMHSIERIPIIIKLTFLVYM